MKRSRETITTYTPETSEIAKTTVLCLHKDVWHDVIAKMLDLKSIVSLSETCKGIRNSVYRFLTERKQKIQRIRKNYQLKSHVELDFIFDKALEDNIPILEGQDLDSNDLSPVEKEFVDHGISAIYHRNAKFYGVLWRFLQFPAAKWPRQEIVFNALCDRFENVANDLTWVSQQLPESPEREQMKFCFLFQVVEVTEFGEPIECEDSEPEGHEFDLSKEEDRKLFLTE